MNLSKCEYLIVGNEEINDLTLDTGTIKGVKCSKYLGIIFNKKGNSENEIQERINRGRAVTRTINSLLWNKKITRATKKRMYSSLVQSVTLYGSELWDVTKASKNKLMATEMDFLRRSCGRSRLERVRNDDIRMQMHMERHIHEDIEKRQLTWFGHVKRMNADRWPRKVLEWTPLERRKRGRPRRSWRDDINQAMTARTLAEDEVFDRKRWKLGTERRQQL
nr:unnamed protein product [Callosobruchus analis]